MMQEFVFDMNFSFANRNFSDAHIFFLFKEGDSLKMIFGLHRNGFLSSFGGKSEQSETVLSTLLREYVEEAREVIVDLFTLADLLRGSRALFYVSDRCNGHKGLVSLVLLPENFQEGEIVRNFRAVRFLSKTHAGLAQYDEILDIVIVRVDRILDAINSEGIDPPVIDEDGKTYTFRRPSLASLRVFLNEDFYYQQIVDAYNKV